MSETVNEATNPTSNQVPNKAIVVKKKRWRISPIWFLPFTALLLALWLGYETYTNRGVVVTIRFNTGSGIAIAKTKVFF